ncbi:RNA recognition motif-containing protein [Malassezia vespertilionis]|uniref:Nop4p n=1 Tax=Malassezia vespertilionis TaxID=2020962 RepID=A0A2N1J9P4_9BASI|nr:RNA recognition motif-containing protein [Malassezia vespertilionis]PKI83265.1 Nop4p [Malassezia vespertilionis]WFD07623.1 RNA recognition motif-containing protein [Malassezia vespertilionis]
MADGKQTTMDNVAPPSSTASVGAAGIKHGSTIFVTRLPYTVTNTDLSTFFSDVGPLRRAFVVTDRETKKSKGVGYVTYADAEDAKNALDKFQGASIDGSRRHIQLEWPDARTSTDGARESKPKVRTSSLVKLGDRDSNAMRTIVISGLSRCSPQADTKSIYKRARKLGDVDNVAFAEKNGVPSTDVAYVQFRTPNHAMAAVGKLHAHQFKGAQLSVELKKRLDGAMRREQHMRPEKLEKEKMLKERIEEFNGSAWDTAHQMPSMNRDSRLIVRNLPFDISLDDLRAIFLPYGAIYDITMPTSQKSESSPERGRGFAFIWYVSRTGASRAIDAINGLSLRHGAAEQALLKKAAGKKGRDAAKEQLDKVRKNAQPARPVAVDWSLSQKDYLAIEKEADDAAQLEPKGSKTRKRSREDEDEDEGEEEKEDEEDHESDDEEDHDENDSSDGDDLSKDGQEDASEADKPQKPTMASTDTGTILFVRNLPYQATEEELKELFRRFGPLRYARIAMDPQTKRSRGTGFVCFWKRESADSALHSADIVYRETAVSDPISKIPQTNPFSTPSVLTADPSAPLVSNFTLHGRVLNVVRAVTRETATELETASRKTREKNDNRNTWLLREGVPFPNTPLMKMLSEKETEKRQQAFSIRRAQLGANPSLHVSKTRLAVHQLPLFVTDKMLKRLALHALRAFTDQVRSGVRADLTKDEKEDHSQSPNIKPSQLNAPGKRPPPSLVIQSKVVRQNERVDPISGQGRSRGYGFLEMRTFVHALKALRWMNGNKDVIGLLMQWYQEDLIAQVAALKNANTSEDQTRMKRMTSTIQDLEQEGVKAVKSELRGMLRVEFSIENITTVRKRTLRQQQAREKSVAKRQRTDAPDNDAASDEKEDRHKRITDTKARVKAVQNADQESKSRLLGSLIGKKRNERKRKHTPT